MRGASVPKLVAMSVYSNFWTAFWMAAAILIGFSGGLCNWWHDKGGKVHAGGGDANDVGGIR